MKKWLYPIIAGGLVLVVGATFTRSIHSRRSAVAAEQAAVNEAQVTAAKKLASELPNPDASSDGKSAAADPAKSVTPDDGAPAVAENTTADAGTDQPHISLNYANAPWSEVLKRFADATKTELVASSMPKTRFTKSDMKLLSRADALEVLNQALKPENLRLRINGNYLILNHLKDATSEARQGTLQSRQTAADAANPAAPDKEEPPKILIVPVQNRDAASLVELIKRMHPKGENIYADPRTNSLIFPNGIEPKYLDIVRELDQPETKAKFDPASNANTTRGSLPAGVFRLSAGNTQLLIGDREVRVLELPARIRSVDGFDPKIVGISTTKDFRQVQVRALVPGATAINIVDEEGQVFHVQVLVNSGASSSSAEANGSLTDLPIVGRLFEKPTATAGGVQTSEEREYRQFEAQAVQLANALRQQQSTIPQDAQKEKELKSELQGAVHSAFHARQSWQRAQAAQLRTRLEQIERRISERSQMSNEIIQRRVDELLNPQKQWDSNDNAAPSGRNESAAIDPLDRPEADAPRHNRARQATAGPKGGSSNVDGPPLEGFTAAESSPARETAQRALRQSARDPRQEMLDAEAAVDESRAALVNSKAIFQWAESISKKAQDLFSKGQVKESEARGSATEADAKRADWQRAETVYEIAERRLKSAREAFALEIKFLEYDLSDAKARMDHAAIELAGTERLYKQNIVSREEYESKKLPQQLAASQYERAKMLLDLYQKSQPDKKPLLDQTRPPGVPDDPSNERGADKSPKKIDLNLPAAADDPRQRVRDAVHAIAAARAEVAEAEANVAGAEQELKRTQTVAPGVIPQREVLRIERSLASARAALQSRRVDLEIREQQFEEAREMLAERIKLLEIDLADAKIRLEEADSEFSQASQLLKKGAIANEQYEKIRVARGLAESQYQRAQLLLDQYRKALPGETTAAANEPSAREKPYKGVWLSDFAAAQEQAAKTRRPIVAFFSARWVSPSKKMKVEVLGNEAVVKAVDERFIGVIVDVDANPEVFKNFSINQIPAIRILREDGELLGQIDGRCTANDLLNLLKESFVRLKNAPRSNSAPAAEEKPDAPQLGENKPASSEKPDEPAATPDNGKTPKPGKGSNAELEE